MRFLHTSDWHLGRLFHSVHLTDDQAHVLEQLVDVARERRVDAVVIAGDVYDRAVPPAEAMALFDETLTRLAARDPATGHKPHVVVLAGNHDSPERLSFASRLLAPERVHVVGPLAAMRAIPIDDGSGKVDVLPIPYATPEAARAHLDDDDVVDHQGAMAGLVARAAALRTRKRRSVVVAHGFVTGAFSCESERPLAVGGSGHVSAALFRDFNYSALGHLHRPQDVSLKAFTRRDLFDFEEPAFARVRYAGSLLKYSFDEHAQQKSISIVELDAAGRATVEAIALSPRRDVRVVEGALHELLARAASDPRRDDYVCARLTDPGPALDAMARLREVYPNALHVEPVALKQRLEATRARREIARMRPLDVVAGFVEATSGQALSDAERAIVVELLERLEAPEERRPGEVLDALAAVAVPALPPDGEREGAATDAPLDARVTTSSATAKRGRRKKAPPGELAL